MLQLKLNRNPNIGSPITLSDLTLSDLKGQSYIFKGDELDPMLLLNINRKPYMGSTLTSSHLTVSHLERSKSRSFRFRSIINHKEAKLGLATICDINWKPYMKSPSQSLYLTLSD